MNKRYKKPLKTLLEIGSLRFNVSPISPTVRGEYIMAECKTIPRIIIVALSESME